MTDSMDTVLFAKVLKVVLQCIEEGSTLLHNFKMDGDSKGTKILMEFQCLGAHGSFQYSDNSFGPVSGGGSDQHQERLGSRGNGRQASATGGAQSRQEAAAPMAFPSMSHRQMKRGQAFEEDTSSTSSEYSDDGGAIGSALHRALGDDAYRRLQKGLKKPGDLSTNSSTSTLTSSEDPEERTVPVKSSHASEQSPRAQFFLGENSGSAEKFTNQPNKPLPRFFKGNSLVGSGDRQPVPCRPPELPQQTDEVDDKKLVLDSYAEPIEDSLNFLKRYAQKYESKDENDSNKSGVILGNGNATAVKTSCDKTGTSTSIIHSSPSQSILKPSVSLDSGIGSGSDNGAAPGDRGGHPPSRQEKMVKFSQTVPYSLAAVPEEVPDSPDLDYPTRADIHGPFCSPRLALAPDDPDWKSSGGSTSDDDDDVGTSDSEDSVELISEARERRLSKQLDRRKSLLTL